MFYLIGLGLKPQHLTVEALAAVQRCKHVFLENYTSRYAEGNRRELEKLLGRPVTEVGRKEVEEGFDKHLARAKREHTALLVFGNPLIATTHVQLLLDARAKGVECQVVPGLSVTDFLAKTGLDAYKFGRVTTVVFPQENYAPESFYDAIAKNKAAGLHTLCLLDIQADKGKLMTAKEAIRILLDIDRRRCTKLFSKATKLIALCALGGEEELIAAGRAERLLDFALKGLPQCLIVCGDLNEKEDEAVKALCES